MFAVFKGAMINEHEGIVLEPMTVELLCDERHLVWKKFTNENTYLTFDPEYERKSII